jgi:hypothetical protein
MQDLHPDILREIVRRVNARHRVAVEATSRTMRGAARPVALEVTRATLAGLCRAVKIAVRLNDYLQQKYSLQKMRIWRPFAREVEADLRRYAAALQSAARPGEGAELSFVMTTDDALQFEVHDLFVGTVNGIRITMGAQIRRGPPLMLLPHVSLILSPVSDTYRPGSREDLRGARHQVAVTFRDGVIVRDDYYFNPSVASLKKMLRRTRRGNAARRSDLTLRVQRATQPERIALKVAARAIRGCASAR